MKAKTRAIIGVVVTVILAIMGLSGYASGSYNMTFFGLELSFGVFLLLIAGMIIYDIFAIIQASKSEEKLKETVVAAQEQLSAVAPIAVPCKVSITRSSSMLGAAMGVRVFLNGTEMGVLKNGKTLDFTTGFSANELTVNSIADNVMKSIRFNAEPGGSVRIALKYSGLVLTIL